jgi:hypothetical protein
MTLRSTFPEAALAELPHCQSHRDWQELPKPALRWRQPMPQATAGASLSATYWSRIPAHADWGPGSSQGRRSDNINNRIIIGQWAELRRRKPFTGWVPPRAAGSLSHLEGCQWPGPGPGPGPLERGQSCALSLARLLEKAKRADSS